MWGQFKSERSSPENLFPAISGGILCQDWGGAVSSKAPEKWVSGPPCPSLPSLPPAAASVGGASSSKTYQETTLLDVGDRGEARKERSGSPGSRQREQRQRQGTFWCVQGNMHWSDTALDSEEQEMRLEGGAMSRFPTVLQTKRSQVWHLWSLSTYNCYSPIL